MRNIIFSIYFPKIIFRPNVLHFYLYGKNFKCFKSFNAQSHSGTLELYNRKKIIRLCPANVFFYFYELLVYRNLIVINVNNVSVFSVW